MSDSRLVTVVFRKFKGGTGDGQIIALFPEIEEGRGLCSSYMHVGQHGAASYPGVVATTVPATPDEYAPLKAELEGQPYGYRFHVVKRWVRRRH